MQKRAAVISQMLKDVKIHMRFCLVSRVWRLGLKLPLEPLFVHVNCEGSCGLRLTRQI